MLEESYLHEKDESCPVLEVKDLKTYFYLSSGLVVKAVDGISFKIQKGKVLGIIGESGSGKSVTSRSIMKIVEKPGHIVGGKILFKGHDLLSITEKKMNKLRGNRISLVFQDPTTSLNPYLTIEEHLTELYRVHRVKNNKEMMLTIIKALGLVGVTDSEAILSKYPCEFSAGFRQRLFIAMSMLLEPELLIADEPTTTLGITTQAEIIEALVEVKEKTGTSIIIITHDFGVVSRFSDDIFVMYAGKCVEHCPKKELLLYPKHPYTVGLIRSVPLLEERKEKQLKTISGFPPDLTRLPEGCSFSPRCGNVRDLCYEKEPEFREIGKGHYLACHYPLNYKTSDEAVLR